MGKEKLDSETKLNSGQKSEWKKTEIQMHLSLQVNLIFFLSIYTVFRLCYRSLLGCELESLVKLGMIVRDY